MVLGVLGEDAVKRVLLGLRQEHAQILHQHMEDQIVPDPQVKLETRKCALVINLLERQGI